MKVAIDACSIILLAKCTLLETLCSRYAVCASNAVIEEVLAGKQAGKLDAIITERLLTKRVIKIKEPKNKEAVAIMQIDFGLGKGEAETAALVAESACNLMLTDNRQGRKIALINNLPVLGSPEIIVKLFKSNLIPKEKAKNALHSLSQYGWFSPYLLEKALEDVQNG